MSNTKYLELKSGSDIRGVASEGMPGQPVTLTAETAAVCARSFAHWLANKCGKKLTELRVSVGRDCRLSSESLANAVVGVFCGLGLQVFDCGGCTTPAMFMTTVDEELACDGAVMITASHLPWNRNGLKFFIRSGGLTGSDITEILKACTEEPPVYATGAVQTDYLSRYAAQLRKKLSSEDKPVLQGLHIVVDAGNGMGGFYAEKVLSPLGADISGSVCLEQDGHFPVHIPNPEEEAAMASLRNAMLSSGAQLGLIFDTDCDRAAVLDADGKEFNRSRLIALVAAILCADAPGSIVVTDSVTSAGLSTFLKALGCVHRRYKRGYNNVIGEARRLNAPVALETSGHCALAENYYLDDGAYLVTRILQRFAQLQSEGKTLGSLVAALEEPVEEQELRFGIACEDFRSYGLKIIEDLTEKCSALPGYSLEADNAEGVRVNTEAGQGKGWFLLRQSVHDPVLPLNLEAYEPGGVLKMAKQLQQLLTGYDQLNTKALDDFINNHG